MRKLYSGVVDHFRSELAVLDDPSLREELGNLLEMAQMDDIPINGKADEDSKKRKADNDDVSNCNSNGDGVAAPAAGSAKKGKLTGNKT